MVLLGPFMMLRTTGRKALFPTLCPPAGPV